MNVQQTIRRNVAAAVVYTTCVWAGSPTGGARAGGARGAIDRETAGSEDNKWVDVGIPLLYDYC